MDGTGNLYSGDKDPSDSQVWQPGSPRGTAPLPHRAVWTDDGRGPWTDGSKKTDLVPVFPCESTNLSYKAVDGCCIIGYNNTENIGYKMQQKRGVSFMNTIHNIDSYGWEDV